MCYDKPKTKHILLENKTSNGHLEELYILTAHGLPNRIKNITPEARTFFKGVASSVQINCMCLDLGVCLNVQFMFMFFPAYEVVVVSGVVLLPWNFV